MGVRTKTADDFWRQSTRTSNGCWEIPVRTKGGYGLVWWMGRTVLAHRLAYELSSGPIPDGLVIDHLCRNRACCNPSHLDVTTQIENLRRAPTSLAAQNLAKTECPRGHPFSGPNLYVTNDGARRCRECRRETNRRLAQRKRVA